MWGSSYLLIADALEGLKPLAVTFTRITLGFVVMAAVPAARGRRLSAEDRRRVAILGVLWLALPLALYPVAQRHVSSSVAGMITGSQPVMAAAIAATLLRRRPAPSAVAGLTVGLIGVVLVVVASTSGSGGSNVGGAALILVAVACYALATNIAVPLQQRYGSLAVGRTRARGGVHPARDPRGGRARPERRDGREHRGGRAAWGPFDRGQSRR
jgi:drug/metabolite transporter (DMT)-like permease